jgi:heptosyltransferase-2
VFLRAVGQLREPRRDLGLVLPNSFSSALMFRWAGIKRRVGYARDARSLLLTDAVPRPRRDGRFRPTYMGDYYLALGEAAGIGRAGRHTELPYTRADADAADEILGRMGVGPGAPLCLLHAGAGYGPSKRWPTDRWAALADMVCEGLGLRPAVIGGPGEAREAAQIAAAATGPIANFVGSPIDLHLLKPVVARSALLVSTDSGPRHYGVALGVPTVCLMGPTHPGYSSSGRPHDVVVRVETECGPCQRKVCRRDHRCMELLTTQMVFDACKRALEKREHADRA